MVTFPGHFAHTVGPVLDVLCQRWWWKVNPFGEVDWERNSDQVYNGSLLGRVSIGLLSISISVCVHLSGTGKNTKTVRVTNLTRLTVSRAFFMLMTSTNNCITFCRFFSPVHSVANWNLILFCTSLSGGNPAMQTTFRLLPSLIFSVGCQVLLGDPLKLSACCFLDRSPSLKMIMLGCATGIWWNTWTVIQWRLWSKLIPPVLWTFHSWLASPQTPVGRPS